MQERLRVLILSNYFFDYSDPWFRIRYLTARYLAENENMEVTIIGPAKNGRYATHNKYAHLREIETPAIMPPGFRRGGFSMLDIIAKTWNVLRNRYDIIHVDMSHRPAGIIPVLAARCLEYTRN